MIVLGIESSCDETAAAIVNEKKEILAQTVLSQLDEHRPYGGVVPEIAARAHLQYIDSIIDETMQKAGLSFSDLSSVAAAGGPGLIGGVMVGVMSAKAIALAQDIPFVAVNHLEGHALMPRLTSGVEFPYLLLLASGGHCQILVVEAPGKYKRLGTTIDDAAGEAYDKVAKMMGLDYPGGPEVEKKALNGNKHRFDLPRPLKGKQGCDLSFSGLKTAVRHVIESFSPDGKIDNAKMSEQDIADLCASFQYAVADSLCYKVNKAAKIFKKEFPEGKFLVVSGGVAANVFLRESLKEVATNNKLDFTAPPLKLCTDNGTMIAWAGLERFRLGHQDGLDFRPRPRWPLDADAPKSTGAGLVKA